MSYQRCPENQYCVIINDEPKCSEIRSSDFNKYTVDSKTDENDSSVDCEKEELKNKIKCFHPRRMKVEILRNEKCRLHCNYRGNYKQITDKDNLIIDFKCECYKFSKGDYCDIIED